MITFPPSTIHGPFSNSEVSIYCDESRHEGQSKQPYIVIGSPCQPRGKMRVNLAGHLPFTAGELDFILNYDIKSRLGRDTVETEDD